MPTPRKVEGYRIVRRLGHGATAELFEARRLGHGGFERRCALKCLLPELAADEAVVEDFVEEARLVSHLHHGNIVGIFDFGFMDGRPFLSLELVDGPNLVELVQSAGGRLAEDVALYIVEQVAHALDYAHAARGDDGRLLGIVHRDVAPDNILVSNAGDVKLADFGIARARARAAATRIGIVRGKLSYMSPEQYRQDAVDGLSDVFSLGCVLHELLTGHSPLHDRDVRQRVLGGSPVPLALDLSPNVRTIVERAVAPNRADRFESAGVMAAACVRARRSEESGRERLRRIVERPPEPVARPPGPLSSLLNVELILNSRVAGVSQFGTLDGPVPPPLSEGVDTVLADRDPLVGVMVGSCRIDELIGEGSYGRVFRATHLGLGHTCAVKILRGTGMRRAVHERFEREAEALTRLDHPNLVRLFDVGVHDQRPYIVTEFVPGRTLRDVVRSQLLTPSRALHIIRQIADGLAAAHGAGCIHRDLKPLNVMITGEGGLDHVKILDFGLVRLCEADAEFTQLTKTDALLGTPRWMSPEQVMNPHDVDARSDLYTLALLGQYMIQGVRAVAGALPDVAEARRQGPPDSITEAGPLEPLLLEMLAPDPRDRPANANVVVRRLDELEKLEPTAVKMLGPTNVVEVRHVEVRPGWVITAAFVLIATAFGAAYLIAGPERTPTPTSTRVDPTAIAAPTAAPTPSTIPAPPSTRTTPPVPARRKTPRPARVDNVRTQQKRVDRTLETRGLRRSDLRRADSTAEALRRFEAAAAQRDANRTKVAADDLLVRAGRLSLAGVLRRRLAVARRRMKKLAKSIPRDRLVELERRYLDLYTAIRPDLSDAAARSLAEGVDALARDLAE